MEAQAKVKPLTLAQLDAKFPDEDACRSYLQACRWPQGVRCARCDHDKVYELEKRPYHWQCHQCAPDGYRFSVLVGTIFENTNVDLIVWFKVIYLMLSSKKGMSALQIQRMMGFGSYRTAWSMCHKVRSAMGDKGMMQLADGIVEVDETYVGGKAKNKHRGINGRGDGGQGGARKSIVIGAVKRKGNVIARVINRVNSATAGAFVREVVSTKVSLLSTDEHRAYWNLDKDYERRHVNHSRGIYVTQSIHGAVHTNTIEGFWSIVKRGIVGTFHKVSHKYLPLYVNEFEYRYNNRENPDLFGTTIKAC